MPWNIIDRQSPQVRKNGTIFFLIVMWFVVSAIKGSSAKYILNTFKFPLTLSLSHMISTTVYSFPLLYCMGLRNIPVSSWRQFLWFILPMAMLKTLSTVTGHLALWKISVPYNQTIRATAPIFTVILSRVFLDIRQTPRVYLSLIPVVLGVGIASYTESAFSLVGMLLGIAATCSGSVQNVVNKKLMNVEGAEEIHTFELLAILGRLSCLLFIPIWACFDGPKLFEWSQSSRFDSESWYLILVAGDASLNFIQALLAFSVLNCVLATSYAVSNSAKRAFIIILGIIIFNKPVTVLNGIGMSITILGVFLYSYFCIQDNNEKEAAVAASAPVAETDGTFTPKIHPHCTNEAEKKPINSNLDNVELSVIDNNYSKFLVK